MNIIQRAIQGVDTYQQRHPVVGFPFAVTKKYGDDDGGGLASLIAFYGFFSLFPLLLVFVSVLGIVLSQYPEMREDIVDSALGQFPVIGDQLASGAGLHELQGSWIGVVVGGLLALWAGLGVAHAAERGMNTVWDVPRSRWPNFVMRRVRGLIALLVLALMVVLSTFTSGLGSSGALPSFLLTLMGWLVSFFLNLALFAIVYRVLVVLDLEWRDVLPGAIVAAFAWTVLQAAGGYYVTHQVKSASNTYGTFALVIGLLIWISLSAQVTLFCAEINVVRMKHLWPRSLVQPPLSEGDKRAYSAMVNRAQMRPEMDVEVTYKGDTDAQIEAGADADAAMPAHVDPLAPPAETSDAP